MDLAETAQLASLADDTPEGRSIVVLAKEKYRASRQDRRCIRIVPEMQFIPFSSQTRMSGVDQGDVHTGKVLLTLSSAVTSGGMAFRPDL